MLNRKLKSIDVGSLTIKISYRRIAPLYHRTCYNHTTKTIHLKRNLTDSEWLQDIIHEIEEVSLHEFTTPAIEQLFLGV